MRSVALTYDDGPDERSTPRLLDLLSGAGVRATFFPIAPRAAAHPQLIQRMLDEGHVVGLHCEQHERYSDHDQQWCAQDADRGLARLRSLGVTVRLWRTPWGDTPPWTRAVATERNLRLVGWTLDTHDWRGDSAADMFAATRPGLRPGAIVLAHDGIGPGAQRPDASQTVVYTELVLAHAERYDLELEALS